MFIEYLSTIYLNLQFKTHLLNSIISILIYVDVYYKTLGYIWTHNKDPDIL